MTTSAVHRIYKVGTKLPLFPFIIYPLLSSSKTSQQERHVVFLWDFSKNEIRWLWCFPRRTRELQKPLNTRSVSESLQSTSKYLKTLLCPPLREFANLHISRIRLYLLYDFAACENHQNVVSTHHMISLLLPGFARMLQKVQYSALSVWLRRSRVYRYFSITRSAVDLFQWFELAYHGWSGMLERVSKLPAHHACESSCAPTSSLVKGTKEDSISSQTRLFLTIERWRDTRYCVFVNLCASMSETVVYK